MRLRTTLLALASTFTLVFALSGTAHAAQGEFTYYYLDDTGSASPAKLTDPDNACESIPELDVDPEAAAFNPSNYTDATAELYTKDNCGGDLVLTLAPDAHGNDSHKFRSVKFLPAR
ncbi:hypothetical protein AB0K89_07885 [Streptomyces cinnamoneus]|uniref:hypothetical protein n=1 Tax=Streptomyces cinnamoneus TaxID=53446 RepID=UPI003412DE76